MLGNEEVMAVEGTEDGRVKRIRARVSVGRRPGDLGMKKMKGGT